MSTDLWNSSICRCCHCPSEFRDLFTPYFCDSGTEMYASMLGETFDIKVNPYQNIENISQNICNYCVSRLKDATLFKEQVLFCEKKLREFFENVVKEDVVEVKEDIQLIADNSYIPEEFSDYDQIKAQDDISDFIESPQTDTKNDQMLPKKIHKKIKKNSKSPKNFQSNQRVKHTCAFCECTFNTGNKLVKHVNIKHSKEVKYVCSHCNKLCENVTVWQQHYLSHHKRTLSKGRFTPSTTKTSLKVLSRQHTGERKFSCDLCRKFFTQKQTLKSHMLTHTGEKPFVCENCGCQFSQRTHLLRHVRIVHARLKAHSCVVCHKSFSSKSYLKIHERSHTGEKPFSCEHCDRTFAAYTTLKVHMRLHSGVKPYSCQFCDRSFAQVSSYKLHERTHTGEKPFACPVCRKQFSDNGYLKIHINIHKGVKPFSCKVCNRSFRESRQLKRHQRVHTEVKGQISDVSKHMKVHENVKL